MRCAKSYKFWHMWIVPFHLWNGTDRCVKKKLFYSFPPLSSFITFLSYLSYFFSSFFLCLFLSPVTPSSFFFLSSPASLLWLRVFFRSLSLHLSLSLFYFFFPFTISLSLSFPVTKKKAIPIWSRTHRLKLANLKLCSPRGSCRSLLVVLHSSCHWWLVEFGHWLICWVGVLWKILSFYFLFFKFCWGFCIWNLLEDPVIVVVVCGGGCNGGCCCGGGHWLIYSVGVLLKILSFLFLFLFCWGFWIWNLLEDSVIMVVVYGRGYWFLGGGDCHWVVHFYICWVLSKYII